MKELTAAGVGLTRLGMPPSVTMPLVAAFEAKARRCMAPGSCAGGRRWLTLSAHAACPWLPPSRSAGQTLALPLFPRADPCLLQVTEMSGLNASELERIVRLLPHLPGLEASSPFCTTVRGWAAAAAAARMWPQHGRAL